MNILAQQSGDGLAPGPCGLAGASRSVAVQALMKRPGFGAARRAAVSRLTQLFAGDYLLSRLLLEEGRYITIQALLSLAACQQAEERQTWLTLGRLQTRLAGSEFASRNRIEALVAILERYGFVERRKAEDDLRVTLITPTAKLWGADALYLDAFAGPFRRLTGAEGGALPEAAAGTGEAADFDPQAPAWTSRDLSAAGSGHRTWHRILAPHLDRLFLMRAAHLPFQHIVARDGGYLVLLLALEQADRTGSTRLSLPYETVSSNAGVSRTHARQLVEQAEAEGFLRLLSRGGREVEATEALLDAADFWFADHALFLSDLSA